MRPTDYKRIRLLTVQPGSMMTDERTRALQARDELRDLVLDELLRKAKQGNVEAARLLFDASCHSRTKGTEGTPAVKGRGRVYSAGWGVLCK